MTGKIIDSNAPVALALILPIALVLVVLYTAWPFLLLVIALIIGWKIWENYQWRKLSQKVNPFFNRLVKEHQGCLTLTDLATEPDLDLNPRVAKQYLEKKAEEYGAQRQQIENKGTVYYFLTASALGSMFEDSEPVTEPEIEELTPQKSQNSIPNLEASQSQPLVSEIAQLVDLEPDPNTAGTEELEKSVRQSADNVATLQHSDLQPQEPIASESTSESSDFRSTTEDSDLINHQSLIQAELAKRLALNSSTVGRRKSDPDFPEWSKSKDPESIAWKYVPETKVFVPADM